MSATRVATEEDVAFATIGELRALLDARSLSSVELTRLCLDRLSRLGPQYNAVAALMPDRALAEAAAADERLANGRPRSILDSIPYGVKDLLAARGAPTTYSSGPFADQVLDYDAAAVARLDRAGAVLAAKLAMMELAGFHSGTTGASLHGPGRNPWDVRSRPGQHG